MVVTVPVRKRHLPKVRAAQVWASPLSPALDTSLCPSFSHSSLPSFPSATWATQPALPGCWLSQCSPGGGAVEQRCVFSVSESAGGLCALHHQQQCFGVHSGFLCAKLISSMSGQSCIFAVLRGESACPHLHVVSLIILETFHNMLTDCCPHKLLLFSCVF